MIAAVVTQHVSEASGLWLLRRLAITSPHCGLPELDKLDRRVEANLDGLRIAGDGGWRFSEAQLATNEEGDVFAAGVIAFESAGPEQIAKTFSVVEEEPKTVDGLVSALGWLSVEQAQTHIQNLLRSDKPVHQRVGIAAAAIHRRHPGQALSVAVRAEDLRLRARALKAAGELQDKALVREVTEALAHADPGCRFAAAWAGVLLGLSAAVPVLHEIAVSGSFRAAGAAGMALRRMDPDDNLPWPEPALVQKWWDKNRGQFQNGTRYLLGKPMTIEWLKTVLRDGRQRQRAAAALELAIRQPGTPLFNVKAPGFRQIQLLGKPGPPIR